MISFAPKLVSRRLGFCRLRQDFSSSRRTLSELWEAEGAKRCPQTRPFDGVNERQGVGAEEEEEECGTQLGVLNAGRFGPAQKTLTF